ncbi:hypothetical protein DP033_21170 [Escherichia coli]|nr:hypothetical protein [Escherichia coli]
MRRLTRLIRPTDCGVDQIRRLRRIRQYNCRNVYIELSSGHTFQVAFFHNASYCFPVYIPKGITCITTSAICSPA